jgi:hypothetical protein
MVQNTQNIGMIDTGFEALVNDRSFTEACNFFRNMPSDLINRTRKRVPNRFIVFINLVILLRGVN